MTQQHPTLSDVGFQPDVVEVYHTALRRGEETQLEVHLYLADQAKPAPMFVWFHAGGFRTGRIVHRSHWMIAQRLNAAGISMAFPEYRLRGSQHDLQKSTRQKIKALEDRAHPQFPGRFRKAQAMAAFEDGAAFVAWLEAQRARLDIAGPIILGGSSAGAITALNLIYLAPAMGWSLPPIGGVVCMSGGFAFPDLAKGVDCPVMALHNPKDHRVPLKPILELASRKKSVSLTLSGTHEHGDYRMSPKESKDAACNRLIEAVFGFTRTQPEMAK